MSKIEITTSKKTYLIPGNAITINLSQFHKMKMLSKEGFRFTSNKQLLSLCHKTLKKAKLKRI